MSTKASPAANSGNRLWGIYHTDRDCSRIMGHPLRTVVEAPTKLAAEECAARLGFGDAWAHPATAEEAKTAQWLPTSGHQRKANLKRTRGIVV